VPVFLVISFEVKILVLNSKFSQFNICIAAAYIIYYQTYLFATTLST